MFRIPLAILFYSLAACHGDEGAVPIVAACASTANLTATDAGPDARCTEYPVEAPDRSSCIVFEVMSDASAAKCEDIATGLCTPGAAPCRAEPVDVATVARSLSVYVGLTDKVEKVSATVDGSNMIVVGSDGIEHLVCESLPLTPGTSEWTACRSDPNLDLDKAATGWCYTPDQTVVRCSSGFRFGGGARPREGSQIAVACGC